MNTVEEQTESKTTTSRARPLTDEPIFAELCDGVASRSAELNLDRSATTISSRSATKRAHRLTRDSHSSHLMSVLCAYTTFTMLTAGLVLILWGAAVKSERLAVEGFLLTLVGCSYYGCRLFGD